MTALVKHCGWVLLRFLPLIACACGPDVEDTDGPAVGLLVPFTGEFAAPGTNIERVALTLKNSVNEAGGVAGRPLRIVSKDTHSEVLRGLDSAAELAADASVLAFVGPDQDELTVAMQASVLEPGWPHILPGITAADLDTPKEHSRFRIGPVAEGLGCALAELAYDLGYRNIVILNGPDSVSQAFGEAVAATLDGYDLVGRAAYKRIPVGLGAGGISQALAEVAKIEPDVVVAAASAEIGVKLVHDTLISSGAAGTNWLLAPSLLNTAFLANLFPGAVEGALGVAPAVAFDEDASGLADRVEASFGDTPFTDSYYYYDALALSVLAIEAAAREASGTPTREQVAAQIPRVARAPGQRVRWNQIPEALAAIRAGGDVDYIGITGNLSLDGAGDTDHESMRYRQERAEGERVVFEAHRVCVPVSSD